jgi:UrcA family protein
LNARFIARVAAALFEQRIIPPSRSTTVKSAPDVRVICGPRSITEDVRVLSFMLRRIISMLSDSRCPTLAIALIVLTTAFSALVQAEEPVTTEKVRVDRYNLQTEAGSRALLQVLSAASQRVCGVEEARNSRQFALISRANRCYETSLSAAVSQVKSERLSQLLQAQRGIG